MVAPTKKRAAELKVLEKLIPLETDPHGNQTGVLLSDEIIFYAEKHDLIGPFDRANLKPAAYELTIGNEYFLGGQYLPLEKDDPEKGVIVIPPFEVAVIKTEERICLPRFMIARWNIKVRHAYSGLLWVGGPQVDPGYVGHLFCPIYNLSDTEVRLHAGEQIAVVDFVKTSPFDPAKPPADLIRYPGNRRPILEDFNIDHFRSALFTRAGEKLAEFEEAIKGLETRFITFTQISFALFAIFIALAATLSRVNMQDQSLGVAIWGGLTFALSIAALLIAMFSYVGRRIGRLIVEQYGRLVGTRVGVAAAFVKKAWLMGVTASMFVAIAGGIFAYWLVAEPFEDIRQQRVLVKSDLESVQAITTENFRALSSRIDTLEKNAPVRADELARIRQELQRQIDAITSQRKGQ